MQLSREEYKRYIAIVSRKAVEAGFRFVEIRSYSGLHIPVVIDVSDLDDVKKGNIKDVKWKINKEEYTLDSMIDYLMSK